MESYLWQFVFHCARTQIDLSGEIIQVSILKAGVPPKNAIA